MADGQYVQTNPDGSYSVVVGGQVQSTTTNLQDAQNQYNKLTGGAGFTPYGGGGSAPTPSSGVSSGGGGGSTAPGYTPTVQNLFQGTYGAGQSGMTPYQIWLQQSVQNGTMTPQQAMAYGLPQSSMGSGGGGVSAAIAGGMGSNPNQMVQTWDGSYKTVAEMQQLLQQAGSNQSLAGMTLEQAASTYNAIAQNAQAQATAAQQNQAMSLQSQNAGATSLITALLPSLQGIYGPGVLTEINAELSKLGMPTIAGGQGTNVNPYNLTPAQWDALPTNVQQAIINAYIASGGTQADFIAAIDRQRPAGNASSPTGNVQFAKA